MRDFEPPPWVTCEGELAHGFPCEWFGDPTGLTLLEWVPEHHRDNPSPKTTVTLECCPECVQQLTEWAPKWAKVVIPPR